MICFYVGTPGSGKSYEAVEKIVQNLKMGRVVCTNIDGMEVEKHQRYLQELCGLNDYQFKQQFIYLTRDQVLRFWESDTVTDDLGGELIETKVDICPKGALIIIDEVHKFFNARDWQKSENRALADWASTHRHDGYDLVFITQDIEKVDKQVRTLTEWTYLFRKVNFLGGAVQKKYLAYSYMGDEHKGTPVAKNVRSYNAKIFPCYKSYSTADAKEVGFMTHVNILKHPIFFAIPVVLGFLVYMVSKSSFASGDLFGAEKKLQQAATQQKAAPVPSQLPKPVPHGQASSSRAPLASSVPVLAPPPPPAWRSYPVEGYVTDGRQTVYLVHGRMMKAPECKNYSPTAKTIDCFGPELLPVQRQHYSAPVAAAPVDEKLQQVSKYEPAGKITHYSSVHLSDDKQPVVLK